MPHTAKRVPSHQSPPESSLTIITIPLSAPLAPPDYTLNSYMLVLVHPDAK
jgi:hypothetical protein